MESKNAEITTPKVESIEQLELSIEPLMKIQRTYNRGALKVLLRR
jgi:hypothetical protein